MLQLGKILPARMRDAGLARQIVIAQILEEVRKWIISGWGAETAKKVFVKSLVRGEIVMHTDSAVFAQELRLRERDLIETINTKFKGNIASRIKFDSRHYFF